MRTGTRELQLVAINAIEQQPIRFYVQITKTFPISPQWMIFVSGREASLFDQQ